MWMSTPTTTLSGGQAPSRCQVRRGLVLACVAWLACWVPGSVLAATATASVDPKASLSTVMSSSVKPVELVPLEPTGTAAGAAIDTPAEIDLLLEMQLEDRDWGATPADAPASGPQLVTVDVRSLSPGLPANPAFPGYGLSYEPPLFPPKAALDLPPRIGQAGAPGAQTWARRTAAWFGLETDAEGREKISAFRQWLADHRVALLGGLGVVAVGFAAMLALARPPARSAPERPRSRRRGRRHHRSPPT